MALKKFFNRLKRIYGFHPFLPASVDQGLLVAQAAGFWGLPTDILWQHYHAYRRFHDEKGYEQKFGERKTLSFEEAFLIYLAALRLRPARVVEIGSQFGKSARRIVDLLRFLELNASLTCFDVIDELQYVNKDEVELVLHDLTGDFRERVLEDIAPGLIYLDAHPYALLNTVIHAFLPWAQSHPAVLAIHDCSPGLYNPHMRISKDDPNAVSSRTGLWERHVLSEAFQASDASLDDLVAPAHRLKIFATTHGLALIAPRRVLEVDP